MAFWPSKPAGSAAAIGSLVMALKHDAAISGHLNVAIVGLSAALSLIMPRGAKRSELPSFRLTHAEVISCLHSTLHQLAWAAVGGVIGVFDVS